MKLFLATISIAAVLIIVNLVMHAVAVFGPVGSALSP